MLARLLVLLVALAPCEALVVGAARLAPSHSLSARAPLRNVLLQEVPPPPPTKLGATVDQDGKSNVWVSRPSDPTRAAPRIPLVGAILSSPPTSGNTNNPLLLHTTTIPITAQAVEPAIKVEKTDKGLLQYAPVIGVAALAIAAVPLLPILFGANPDQA